MKKSVSGIEVRGERGDLNGLGPEGLPGGPQEGSRLDGSSIFTFAAEPKKGSKMRAKMERFGSQGRHYTPFRSPMSRK